MANWKRVLLGADDAWYRKEYFLDYLVFLLLFAFSGVFSSLSTPYERYQHPLDSDVEWPLLADIVPVWLLFSIGFGLPIVVFLFVQIYFRSHHDFHHAFVALCLSQAFTQTLTSVFKIIAGRPRPNWDALTNDTNDARMSFPSGHASTSFCGMVLVSLYLAGKMKLFSSHRGSVAAKSTLAFAPLMICSFVAVSRTMDYHHHFDDILAGALIGAGTSLFCYFLYYPSLFHPLSNFPKPTRDEQMAAHHHDFLENPIVNVV